MKYARISCIPLKVVLILYLISFGFSSVYFSIVAHITSTIMKFYIILCLCACVFVWLTYIDVRMLDVHNNSTAYATANNACKNIAQTFFFLLFGLFADFGEVRSIPDKPFESIQRTAIEILVINSLSNKFDVNINSLCGRENLLRFIVCFLFSSS